MKAPEILEILADWNFWKKGIDSGIERKPMVNKARELLKTGEIAVITGVRRSGKSTLLLQVCKNLMGAGVRKEDILIVNFEDPRFKKLDLELLNKLYEIYLTELNPGKKHYVILDEVQSVDGWEKFARYLHENKKVSVFVTGSSSKLLSSEYSTVLAGRHLDMEVCPLSFREFLLFRGIQTKNMLDVVSKRHAIKRVFPEYLKWGGFPKVVLAENENEKRMLLNTYFNDIVIKDAVKRYNIKEIGKLEELAKYYLTNTASLQSFSRARKYLGLNLDTVERFSYYLSNAYLLSFVKKFSYSRKEQMVNPRKVYCVDTGLRNSAGFVFSEDLGRLAENVVYNKIKKNGEVYYWKDGKGREVDFVVREGSAVKEVVQACLNIENPATKKRETTSLLNAMKKFRLKRGLVITEDYEKEEAISGKTIEYVPLWKWLLMPFR